MRIFGEQMSESVVVKKILRTLSEKFNYTVISIEESKDIDALTISELQSSLIVHEQKFHMSHGEEKAHKATHEERNGGSGRGRAVFKGGRGRGPITTIKQLLSVTNAINLDTINMSVQCGKSKPIIRR